MGVPNRWGGSEIYGGSQPYGGGPNPMVRVPNSWGGPKVLGGVSNLWGVPQLWGGPNPMVGVRNLWGGPNAMVGVPKPWGGSQPSFGGGVLSIQYLPQLPPSKRIENTKRGIEGGVSPNIEVLPPPPELQGFFLGRGLQSLPLDASALARSTAPGLG